MDLSIIIVSWNVAGYLKKCLESIKSETKDISFEVIVVDNNSSDQTVKLVKQKFPWVRLIVNDQNLGFAKANNQGLKVSQGKYILFLNPDCKIIDRALEKMISFLEGRPAAALAGCRLLNSDGSLQPSIRRFPKVLDHLGMLFKLHHFWGFKRYLAKDFDYTKEAEVEQLMGAFIMMRREVLEKIGYFDQGYKIWFEEVDYCYRAKLAGLKIFYTPAAQIVHYGGQSFGADISLKKQWRYSCSRLRFIKKYDSSLNYYLVLILTPVSLLLTSIASLFEKND